ncbi:hypothetical protein SAMN05216389_11153 [Oceanobacillus limi]|uniref:Uncharacterized protein n=1 Tax=Oceanobacillus limi TaxID=930131 RepID=A0A1I0EF89_9BACI|nr:hypothetical protein [Oceanobacillus limi]SET43196.1 hypothetical protein SAMN05216389_11153 [Oceanobacillus limi]
MTRTKSTDWRNLPLDKWNTLTFHAYLSDKHEEMFGVEYVPYRGWQAEKGLIGNLIGTKTKGAKYDKAIVKRFIDEAMSEYKPTRQYPGTSFGWLYTYRKQTWQRVLAEVQRKEERKEAQEIDVDDISGWL